MKLIEIQNRLLESRLDIFSAIEFRRVMGVSQVAAQKLLERYTKKGLLERLKAGLYALKNKLPSPYLVSNRLYKPSYISFETALSYYRLIPEAVYSYTSATTKTTREFISMGRHFYYHKIKKQAFTGYKLSSIGGIKILLAEKEKALSDYLYFVYLKKKSINERLVIKGIKRKKFLYFTALFKKRGFKRWIKCWMKNN